MRTQPIERAENDEAFQLRMIEIADDGPARVLDDVLAVEREIVPRADRGRLTIQ